MRSSTAAACGAVVGAALGIGGTLLAQAPTDTSTPARFTRGSIEQVTAQGLGPKVRDVSCEPIRGPFYTCTAYTAPNAGASYDVTVDRNGRCIRATRTSPTEQETIERSLREMEGDDSGFVEDEDLSSNYTGWFGDRADCE